MSILSKFVKRQTSTVRDAGKKAQASVKKTVKKVQSSAKRVYSQVEAGVRREAEDLLARAPNTAIPSAANLLLRSADVTERPFQTPDPLGSELKKAFKTDLDPYFWITEPLNWLHKTFTPAPAPEPYSPHSTYVEPMEEPEIEEMGMENMEMFGEAAGAGNEFALETAQALNPTIAAEFYKYLEQALPGFKGLVGDMSSYASSLLSGQLPPDVQQYLEMILAEQGIQRGIGGSAIGRNLVARDLGKTSLDLMQQGFSNASSLIATARQHLFPPLVDIASTAGAYTSQMAPYTMMSPNERAQVDMFNKQMEYNIAVDRANQAQEQWAMEEDRYRFEQHRRDEDRRMVIETAFEFLGNMVPGGGFR